MKKYSSKQDEYAIRKQGPFAYARKLFLASVLSIGIGLGMYGCKNPAPLPFAPDTDAPTIKIISPVSNQVISRNFPMSVNCKDNMRLKSVTLSIDDFVVETREFDESESVVDITLKYFIPTYDMTNGPHKITASAKDIYHDNYNISKQEIMVRVDN